ncbi:hypothetical protein LTR74_009282 [Friedmanniomyces endolithicus]|nr:hypothetical protein LTR74_009282 [Friedmanniomyces endolithicus]
MWNIEEWMRANTAQQDAVLDRQCRAFSPPSGGKRKRERAIQHELPERDAARRPLDILGTNTVLMTGRRQSPRKVQTREPNDEYSNDATPKAPPPRQSRAALADQTSTGSPRKAKSARTGAVDDRNRELDARFQDVLLPAPHPSPPRPSPTRSDTSSQQSSSSRRSKSPVKNLADLRLTDASIAYTHVATASVPDDVQDLHQRLKDIHDGIPIIPQAVKQAIEERGMGRVRSWSLSASSAVPDPAKELDMLEEIWHAATDCHQQGASEAAWNDDVHSCVFRAAFKPYNDIRSHNVTTARPFPEFMPRSGSGQPVLKVVDYTVNFEPSPADQDRIITLLRQEPQPLSSIVQTPYHPVRFKPAAFSIETKVDGGEQYARIQLGLWAAAHYLRLERLLQQDDDYAGSMAKLPTHPLLVANSHAWSLHFACQRRSINSGQNYHSASSLGGGVASQGDVNREVQIIDAALELGNTQTLVGVYKLVASLRCLADWSRDEMWPRWVDIFLNEDS